MSKTTLVKIPKLASGDDKSVAEVLAKHHDVAIDATKVIFDAGLYCYYIKEQLKQGEFGPWLQAHAPERMWRLNGNGKPVASSTLSWQMGFTKKLIEKKCKTTIGKLLSQIPKAWEFARRGEFLQLSEGSALLQAAPEQLATVHSTASKIAEGKTAYQLFLEFKQTDDEDGDEQKPKRGRRKGEGGATKEQRERAKAAEERAEIEAMELDAEDFNKWMDKVDDLKGIPRIGDKALFKHFERVKYHYDFLRKVVEARKGGAR